MTDAPAVRRRHPGRTALIVLAVLVVLIVVALFVVDGLVRTTVERTIETQARSSLNVPASTPIDATVGGGPVLLQLAAGSLDHVDIRSKGLAIGALTGDAHVVATGLPLDQSQSIDTLKVSFATGQAGLQKLLANITNGAVDSASIASGAVKVTTTLKVLGFSVPVGISAVPAAVNGELTLTPKSFEVAGNTVDPSALTSTLGSVAEPLTKTQTICVASSLPKGFTLRSVTIAGSTIALSVSASHVVLAEKTFTTVGTCP